MHDPSPLTRPTSRAHLVVGVVLAAGAVVTLLIGRVAVSVFLAGVCVVSYQELRRSLAPWGHVLTLAIGGTGVLAFLWSGYTGRLELLPVSGAALVIALLVSRVALNEAGAKTVGMTEDVSSTIAAAAVVGVLGAHILLIRAIPHTGFRGLLVFASMVIGNDVAKAVVSRMGGRRQVAKSGTSRTVRATVAGFVVSVLVGLVAGLTLDPPFGLRSGLAFGAGVGVIAPLGERVFSVIKRSAGTKPSGGYLTGVLDAADAVLFAAPAFYWAFRTIAL